MELPRPTPLRIALTGISVMLAAVAYLLIGGTRGAVIAASAIALSAFLVWVYPAIKAGLGGMAVKLNLVYAVLHMWAVSTGRPPPGKVFRSVGDPRLYGEYSKVFKKIYILGKEWGYSYPDAISYTVKRVYDKVFREFLMRLATVIKLGEDLQAFLAAEYKSLMNEYSAQYERAINSLRVILGVYTAAMAAMVFSIANFMLLAFFFGGSPWFIPVAYLGAFGIALALSLVVLKMLPDDLFEYKEERNPEARRIQLLALASLLSASVVSALYLYREGVSYETSGVPLIIAGAFLIGPGIKSLLYERKIDEVDVFFPVFIRSIGTHLSVIPSLASAVKNLLPVELGRLKKHIVKMYARLQNDLNPEVCWRMFAYETGSEIVRRSVKVLSEALELGGDPGKVGEILSDHNNQLITLRRLRQQVAGNFMITTIVMHASMVMIAVFIAKLLEYFTSLLSAYKVGIPPELADFIVIGSVDTKMLMTVTVIFSILLTVVNAYMIARVRPRSILAFWYFLAILAAITGVTLITGSKLMDVLLGKVIGIEGFTGIAPG
ncbi:MAG: type II secretion system F family protein [Desulfurococcales archaeon]|nr:type II secretion system F family protein [Desulfurococcales archaeon]